MILGAIVAENSLEDPRFAQTREQVAGWLQEYGHLVALQTPRSPFVWALNVTDPFGFVLTVGQYRAQPDFLAVGSRIILSEPQVERVERMASEERIRFMAGIALHLLGMGLDSTGYTQPLEWIGIGKKIHREELTRKELVAALEDVKRGFLSLGWCWSREFGEPPPAIVEPEEPIH